MKNIKEDKLTLEERILRLQTKAKYTSLSIHEILQVFSGKGRSLILILLSLPFCQPIQIPGISTAFGLGIAFLSLRMIFRKPVWLPKRLLAKTIPSHTLRKMTERTLFIINKIRRFIHPRLDGMCHGLWIETGNGLLTFLLGVVLALPLPIPFSNLLAAWSIFLISLGILEDDGLFVLFGYIVSLITMAFFMFMLVESGHLLKLGLYLFR